MDQGRSGADNEEGLGPCLNWTRYVDYQGYGQVGRSKRISRVVWEQERGPIPNGLCVLHRCDNPSCYRIDHLFLGTKADNSRDMVAKGRAHLAKLSPNDVLEIKARINRGEVQRALAREYRVHATTINRIARGRSWKEVMPRDH